MTPSAAALNKSLHGFTDLTLFHLEPDSAHIAYDLTLTSPTKPEKPSPLQCSDVQNLELNPNGEDFKKFIALHVEDLREDGLDRIRYSLEDIEHETIFLHCATSS